jgi:hypothetical protein
MSDSNQTPVQRKRGRPVEPTSKLGQARALRASDTSMTRSTFIEKATASIPGLTKEVAGTYWHLINKAQ